MMRILLVFGSGEGQTAKVSQELAEVFTAHGAICTLVHGDEVPSNLSLAEFDGVLVGASIHMGRYQKYMVEFAHKERAQLTMVPSAFYSVCLTAAGERPEDRAQVESYLNAFFTETGWEPDLVGSFAGAVKYSQYNFIKRFIMRRIASQTGRETDTAQDYEYTDWTSVEQFAEAYVALVEKKVVSV